MATRKKADLSRGERRRLRTQQIFFTVIAVLIIATFVISLVQF
jgi:predicted nucleic acid-binding Zn ribbon protein